MLEPTLISVVGPTASGKTSLALRLAERLIEGGRASGAAIISADSRQVYRGLEILSGADVPPEFQAATQTNFKYRFYQNGQLSLHGVSIINPDEEWSVAHFRELSQEVAAESFSSGQVVIVVGGTGLYHRHLFSADPQLDVPPDEEIRASAAQLPLQELQAWAEKTDPDKFSEMNHSDRHNPRRLIRVIEIGQAGLNTAAACAQSSSLPKSQKITIGFKVPKEVLARRIKSRVEARLAAGANAEVEAVFNRYQDQGKIPAFTTLGFKELLSLAQGEINQEEVIEIWSRRELSYSKRQMTWFNKYGQINWFDYDAPDLLDAVYQLLVKKL